MENVLLDSRISNDHLHLLKNDLDSCFKRHQERITHDYGQSEGGDGKVEMYGLTGGNSSPVKVRNHVGWYTSKGNPGGSTNHPKKKVKNIMRRGQFTSN